MQRFPKKLEKNPKNISEKKHKQRNCSSGTPANESNMISNKVKLKNHKKDLFEIIYYNYNKKSHYAKTCFKSKKDNSSKN